MKSLRGIVATAILLGLMTSCHRTRLEESLCMAGNNRAELESVLRHYVDDSLKYKAAVFLIENMQGLYSLDGPELDSIYARMDSAYADCGNNFVSFRRFLARSLKNIDWYNLERHYDLECISAEYLIRNIDDAFSVRNARWCRDLSFDDFCEYILPYRIGNEVLEYWRDDYRNAFGRIFDSVDLSSDSALWIICDSLSSIYVAHNYAYPQGFPNLKPSKLRNILLGPCDEYANLFVFIGRTFGIPVARDFTPQWANFHSSHDWASVLVADTAYSFAIGDGTRLGQHISSFTDHFMTKVYRHSFRSTPHSDNHKHLNFDFDHVTDVTSQFFNTQTIVLNKLQYANSDDVFLSVFDNKCWSPIDCAKRINDSVAFLNVRSCPAVYLPVAYKANKILPLLDPFILSEDGSLHMLTPDTASRRKVILTRKYLDARARRFTQSIVGGTFEFSNDSLFSSPVVLTIPDSVGLNYQSMWFDSNETNRFQYFRYRPHAGQFGEVAEIEIFDQLGDSLRGNVISNYLPHRAVSPRMAFDGEVLTFAACPDTCWLGLDFGRPRDIHRIDFLPHSDDNFIREGEEYELWFWMHGSWVSLGKQTGSRATQVLVYDNVPSNALLLLRDNTKGTEERIFTYEGGRQVWW